MESEKWSNGDSPLGINLHNMGDLIPAEAEESLVVFWYELTADSDVRLVVWLPHDFVRLTAVVPASVVCGGVAFRPNVISYRIQEWGM